jgi:hypothetical protein
MKVISQDGAAATLLFVPDEVKPLKGYHLPELLLAVGQKYGAAKTPTVEEAKGSAARFENGIFSDGHRKIPLVALTLHNDAIIATTTDTDDSELVIDNLFAWLKESFGFREPVTPAVRLYQSDLVVQFDNDPANAFGQITSFINFIQEEMTPPNATSRKPVQFGYISFGADPIGPGATPEFTIARRANVPWRLGFYFSKAHMRTSAHIRALELLDNLMGKNP